MRFSNQEIEAELARRGMPFDTVIADNTDNTIGDTAPEITPRFTKGDVHKEIARRGEWPWDVRPPDNMVPRLKELGYTDESLAQIMQLPPGRDNFFSALFDEAAAPVGATALALATSGGGIAIQALAATLGGAGGEGWKQVAQHLTDSPDVPKSTTDSFWKMVKSGAFEGAMELLGQLPVRVYNRVARGMSSKTVIPEAVRLGEELEKHGGNLSVAQLTDSTRWDWVDNAVRGSLFGPEKMKQFDLANKEALSRMLEGLQGGMRNSYGKLSDRQTGMLLRDTVLGADDVHDSLARGMYDELAEVIQPARIEQKQFIETVESKVLDEFGKPVQGARLVSRPVQIGGVRVNYGGLKSSADEIVSNIKTFHADIGKTEQGGLLLDKISKLPDDVDFWTAKELRTLLINEKKVLKPLGDEQLNRNVTNFLTQLDNAMGEAAKKHSPEAFKMWRNVNKFYKFGKQGLRSDLMADLFFKEKKSLERVGETIFRTGNVSEIKELQKALVTARVINKKAGVVFDDRGIWKTMQDNWFEGFLGRNVHDASEIGLAPGATEGMVNAKKILKNINFDPKGKRTFETIFDKKQQKSIRDFFSTLSIVQKRSEGGGGMVIQLTQAGAIVSTFFEAKIGAREAALFLSTPIMARLMTNPTAVRLMTQGINTRTVNPKAGALIARLFTLVKKAQLGTEEERKKLEEIKALQQLPSETTLQ